MTSFKAIMCARFQRKIATNPNEVKIKAMFESHFHVDV